MTVSRIDDEDDVAPLERGVRYPADSLEQALAMLERVKVEVGMGATKRDLIAEALGYKSISGHAARKLGSLSHFGLIERSGKGAARISDLGKAILMPKSDEEKATAIVQAVKSPTLYGTLITKYAGHALPTKLPNLLARDHGVNATAAQAAATTFLESVEFAGLLRNGVLSSEAAEQAHHNDPPSSEDRSNSGDDSPTKSRAGGQVRDVLHQDDTADSATFTISLDPRTGRLARITMPIPVTSRDLKNIEAWAAYMKFAMYDDEAPDLSGN